MSDDAELQEYFALVKAVSEFDQRLLTVKSWGVTLSLAALGLGFQFGPAALAFRDFRDAATIAAFV